LRKAIRIKASILLLAWFVIFLHGVIPHNHLDNPYSDCHSILHSEAAENSRADRAPNFQTLPSEKTVCHYSGFIFSQLSSDNLIFTYDRSAFINPPEVLASNIFSVTVLFISDPNPGISALRAPPLL
jgi:hypothetical protein